MSFRFPQLGFMFAEHVFAGLIILGAYRRYRGY